ncbi:transmembrane protein [Thraustotheca clavata]|uniref:Transmembrane protein n=1 Tax=Thraustotheca clavata TaxID=74557 RepID=A0A1V9Y8U5_9STRA|nr:transmembrane protein [Thraustotheca clavata]
MADVITEATSDRSANASERLHDASSVINEWEATTEKERLVESIQVVTEEENPRLLSSFVRMESSLSDQKPWRMQWKDHPIVTSLIVSMPWVGLTMLNSTVFELLTSFMTSIGVARFIPRYLPPLYTFFVAPFIGGHSDRSYSKLGRRNKFLVVATFIVVVTVLIFGHSQSLFGDHLFFHVVNVVFLVHGGVTIEIMLRARLFDEIPRGYQVHAQACGSIWHSAGVAMSMVLLGGGTEVVYGNEINQKNLFQTCCIVAAVLVFTVAIPLYLRPEQPQNDATKRITTVGHTYSEISDTVISAPYELRVLCCLQLFLWMAWSAFDNQKFKWWGSNVYEGCPSLSNDTISPCSEKDVKKYVEGVKLAKYAVQGISAAELIATLSFMVLTPPNPTNTRLHKITYIFMAFGVIMFCIAVIIGSASHPLSFISFVCIGTFYSAIYIFPYAVTGVITKTLSDVRRKFNNNGVYAALLIQFINAGQFVVEEYNSPSLSSMGSSNTMALPVVLFILSFIFTYYFKFQL